MADWRDRIKTSAKASGGWRDRVKSRDATEQDYLAEATQKADVKYEDDKPGYVESAMEGVSKGATFGFDIEATALAASKLHGIPYDQAYNELLSRQRRAERENPGTFLGGDIAGSVATGLMPGMGLAKVAPAAKGIVPMAKALAPNVGKMAAMGTVEGIGRTEGGLEERAKGGVIQGLVGGAIPVGLEGAKKVGSAIKAFAPGSSSSPRWYNNLVSKAAGVAGAGSDKARVYKELLDDPTELKKAMVPEHEASKQLPAMKRELKESFNDIHKQVEDKYVKKQAIAFKNNVEDLDNYEKVLSDLDDIVDDAFDKIDLHKGEGFYKRKTPKILRKVKSILRLKDPKVGDLSGKFEALQAKLQKAIAEGADDAQTEILAKEIDDLLIEKGGALQRARMALDDGIDWAKREFNDEDQQLLLDVRNQIQKYTHGVAGGSKEMVEADALWSAYSDTAKQFMEQFKGRGSQGLSSSKVGKFFTGTGSKWEIGEMGAYRDAAENFLKKSGLKDDAVSNALAKFDDLNRAASMASLSGQTGMTTGRTGFPLLAGLLTGMVSGPMGALVTLMSVPTVTPVVYLKSLNGIRNMISKMGESAVARQLGPIWPAVKSGLARQAAGVGADDLKKQFHAELKAMRGTNDESSGNQSSGMVSPKIKDYFARSNPNTATQIIPGDQGEAGKQLPSGRSERLQIPGTEAMEKSTLGGRSQLLLDQLIGADKIGLDPGEKASPGQPSKYDEQAMLLMPMFAGMAKKVTKLDLNLRMKMLENRGKELDGIDIKRLNALEKISKNKEGQERLVKRINELFKKPMSSVEQYGVKKTRKILPEYRDLENRRKIAAKRGKDYKQDLKDANEAKKMLAKLADIRKDPNIKTKDEKIREAFEKQEDNNSGGRTINRLSDREKFYDEVGKSEAKESKRIIDKNTPDVEKYNSYLNKKEPGFKARINADGHFVLSRKDGKKFGENGDERIRFKSLQSLKDYVMFTHLRSSPKK